MKIFNHEVTAGLLRGWWNEDVQGLHYWNLRENGVDACYEKGKKAKFAGHDYLYVGNQNNLPVDLAFEDGIAKHEQRLVTLANALWQGKGDQQLLAKYAQTALPAITASAVRSKWGLDGVGKVLQLDERKRVAWLKNNFETTYKSYLNWDFTFWQSTDAPLLICDSPLFDFRWRMDSADDNMRFCFMPLGPHAAVTGAPSFRRNMYSPATVLGKVKNPPPANNSFSLAKISLPLNIVSHFNTLTLHRARGWVVAKSREELLKHADFLQPHNLAERIKSDTVIELRNGIVSKRSPL